eukprot:CAMPEP_0113891506 /NCGR_PEP_ID=MMETSP0780_2-20120614/14800_1 /TAXON_ID=652834 /ORGANISM="Palpitomonas bilix" /LENGTH=462 /DNA_ID=CAMNT_0000881143 /DNA_START=29 /DNA_END=1417 /DNA_ORIENTATION=+ /assembly_acc=CAM_ASM_000599
MAESPSEADRQITFFARELCDESFSLEDLEESEKILKEGEEVLYEVQVVTGLLRKDRVLRFTPKAIVIGKKGLSLKKKKIFYAHIAKIELKSGTLIRIKLQDKSEYFFSTPKAIIVIQEALSRLSVSRKVDRRKEEFAVAKNYQEQVENENASLPPEAMAEAEKKDYEEMQNEESAHPPETTRKSIANIEASIESKVTKILFSDSEYESFMIRQFVETFNTVEKNYLTCATTVQQFMSGLQYYMQDHRMDGLLHEAEESGQPIQDIDGFVRNIVDNCLEAAVIEPLHSRIKKSFKLKRKKSDRLLLRKLDLLSEKGQEYFGINPKFVSATNWKAAVVQLKFMDQCQTPSKKLDALLASARAIYKTFNYERNQHLPPSEWKQHILGADDFLPIHIYCLVASKFENPALEVDYLWTLLPERKLQGEGGYYLTCMESAILWINNLDLHMEEVEEMEATFKEFGIL